MSKKKVIITQSNYIPWKGYFDSFQLADEVILYDDMQYTKRDWRNRNQIKTPQGTQWLSIPVEVKGKYFQAIKDTKVSENKWKQKHWRSIQVNYAKSPFIKEYHDILEDLYLNCEEEYLSLINYRFLKGINQILGIETPIRFSSDFTLVEGKTERLVDLCKQIGGTDYYTGPAAKDYMDESLFEQEGIKVHYLDYSGYKEYPQLFSPFVHGVTILDLILNVGSAVTNYMKNF
ncbi:MAG TPA: hypothetical protein DCS93_30425 [Microscillaceae bacterium]|nr:hypothetical protein [Microscillaceae bacterium]